MFETYYMNCTNRSLCRLKMSINHLYLEIYIPVARVQEVAHLARAQTQLDHHIHNHTEGNALQLTYTWSSHNLSELGRCQVNDARHCCLSVGRWSVSKCACVTLCVCWLCGHLYEITVTERDSLGSDSSVRPFSLSLSEYNLLHQARPFPQASQ